ncbi:hypothetical protein [Candidatus Mycobacterium methanotrophicum]|uniref:hypothetical protein n=1 Tax=Candidatus Mycobacterium methanotrophicum TaxID=2943498 RepID=UPI001C585248|nr:hypothetical protein [Candidatus Mycobacterium methanotrophicum]
MTAAMLVPRWQADFSPDTQSQHKARIKHLFISKALSVNCKLILLSPEPQLKV